MAIRDELRARTAEAHRVVGLLYAAHDLGERQFYREFLSRRACVLVPLEARLEAAGIQEILPQWPERRRTGALIADLAVLRGAFQPALVPRLPTRPDIIGCLYVLESSRVGARALLRRVVDGGDPLSCMATRYLAHGIEQRLWGSFVDFLDTQAFTSGEMERAVAAARMTFDLLARSARNATPQARWSDAEEQASL